MTESQVVVFGSINLDLGVQVNRLPTRGETLRGNSLNMTGGGKGANQAIALSRLGIPTRLIGRVGNDDFGRKLQTDLQRNGVNIEGIQKVNITTNGTLTEPLIPELKKMKRGLGTLYKLILSQVLN